MYKIVEVTQEQWINKKTNAGRLIKQFISYNDACRFMDEAWKEKVRAMYDISTDNMLMMLIDD